MSAADWLFSDIARDLIAAQCNGCPYAHFLTRHWARLRARWSQR